MILISLDIFKRRIDVPDNKKSEKYEDGWFETGGNEEEAETNADQDVRPIRSHLGDPTCFYSLIFYQDVRSVEAT